MHPTSHRARGSLRALGAAAILASAMSLLGTAVLAQGVVTLETPAPPGAQQTTEPDVQPTPPSDPQEALLAYVACMREHGVDMPDPQFAGDGGVTTFVEGENGNAQGFTGGPGDPAWQEAQDACGSLMGGTVRDLDPAQQAEMQAQALAFARCMRAHGVDMPDPRFDANGGVTIMIGGPDGPRLDPEVLEEAQTACGGLMGPPSGGPHDADAGVPIP